MNLFSFFEEDRKEDLDGCAVFRPLEPVLVSSAIKSELKM
jgi:hypothetical protein